MTQAEIDFLDNYKRLENFLRDAYDCESGVSTYLSAMETSCVQGQANVASWQRFERQLRNLRRIRNTIAHDACSGGCCGEEDVASLETTIDLFLQRKDPMSLLRIALLPTQSEKHSPISKRKPESAPRPRLQVTPPPTSPKPAKSPGGAWALAAVLSISLMLLLAILLWLAYGKY